MSRYKDIGVSNNRGCHCPRPSVASSPERLSIRANVIINVTSPGAGNRASENVQHLSLISNERLLQLIWSQECYTWIRIVCQEESPYGCSVGNFMCGACPGFHWLRQRRTVIRLCPVNKKVGFKYCDLWLLFMPPWFVWFYWLKKTYIE